MLVNDNQIVSEIEHQDPFRKSDHQVLTFDLNINIEDIEQRNCYRFNLAKGNYDKMRVFAKNKKWNHLHKLDINS